MGFLQGRLSYDTGSLTNHTARPGNNGTELTCSFIRAAKEWANTEGETTGNHLYVFVSKERCWKY